MVILYNIPDDNNRNLTEVKYIKGFSSELSPPAGPDAPGLRQGQQGQLLQSSPSVFVCEPWHLQAGETLRAGRLHDITQGYVDGACFSSVPTQRAVGLLPTFANSPPVPVGARQILTLRAPG